jgi:hypothetical protein
MGSNQLNVWNDITTIFMTTFRMEMFCDKGTNGLKAQFVNVLNKMLHFLTDLFLNAPIIKSCTCNGTKFSS